MVIQRRRRSGAVPQDIFGATPATRARLRREAKGDLEPPPRPEPIVIPPEPPEPPEPEDPVDDNHWETDGTITLQTLETFLGRDARTLSDGKKLSATRGLTNWVAANYRHLELGPPPTGTNRINSENREEWEELTRFFLRRWFPAQPRTYCIRRAGTYSGRTPKWYLFRHPDHIGTSKIVNNEGEHPVAIIGLRENSDGDEQHFRIFGFRKMPRPTRLATDLSATFAVRLIDPYSGADWQAAPDSLCLIMDGLEDAYEELTKKLDDWLAYLNWRYNIEAVEEWGASIRSIKEPTSNNPYYVFTIRAEEDTWGKIQRESKRPVGRKTKLMAFESARSSSKETWIRKDEDILRSSFRESVTAGQLHKIVGKRKPVQSSSLLEGKISVTPPDKEELLSGLDPKKFSQGHFIVNDISKQLVDMDRQRKGIASFKEFQSADLNQVHDWLFDISEARPIEEPLQSLTYPTSINLNPDQEGAVLGALQAKDVFLIQGPPGTGKTTVIAEIINQATQDGKKVLLASQSNDAVDNALGKLSKSPNVRPIRRYGRSRDPDPEAEKFLENKVVSEFFVPSIENKCREQHEASLLTISKNGAMERLAELPGIKDEWIQQRSELKDLVDRIAELKSEGFGEQKERDQFEGDLETLNAAKNLLDSRSESKLTPEMSALMDVDREKIEELAEYEEANRLFMAYLELSDHLDKAEADGDYDEWAKKLHIITNTHDMPDHTQLIAPAKPKNFAQMTDERNIEAKEKAEEFNSTIQGLKQSVIATRETLIVEIESAIDGLSVSYAELLKQGAARKKKIDGLSEDSQIPGRRVKDAEDNWRSLIEASGLRGDEFHEISTADPKAAIESSVRWMDENSEDIEKDESWSAIIEDWLQSLEKPEDRHITDLKEAYESIVNVEGVTTSYAGRPPFRRKHIPDPFDYVIIDEISKATPTELLLPMLVGRRVILVGDYMQLPPVFKDPSRRNRVDQVSPGEALDDDAKLRKKVKKFKELVSNSLFLRYFDEAHDSIKHRLTIQYRMHSEIMDCVNIFYQGELKAGLSEDQENSDKQHGFTIEKSDSGGTSLAEGSTLIGPENHVVWVDSTFNREGNYCPESDGVRIRTSRRNEREVELASRLLDEFDEQVRQRKSEIHGDDWDSDNMLKHLNPEGRLPVGFITFYQDQVAAFQEIANEGKSWDQMKNRWPDLAVRADNVDKFQGSERPIIICSTVLSPKPPEGQIKEFEKRISQISYNPIKIENAQGRWKNGGIPDPMDQSIIPGKRTPFASNAERINVALSRAQNLLVILGNRYTFQQAEVKIRKLGVFKNSKRQKVYKEIQKKLMGGGKIDGRDLQ